jgi:hypothetical protein
MDQKKARNSESGALRRSPELMNAADTLLCLVDLQERLLPAIIDHERIVWNARRLLDGATILGVEMLATEQYPEKLGRTSEPLAERLKASPVPKLTFSSAGCFDVLGNHVDESDNASRHRVLIAGVETHVCVQQTAYDLVAAGFQVFVATDATGTRFAKDYEIALRRMESAGVVLTTTEAVLFEWCVEAGTPEFKEVSRLVKELPPSG